MADNEASIALVALAVGLVALAIATGQLLQQMFSTADGYRRCASNVLGPWSLDTEVKWHWGQFRFETRYMTPEIVLQELRESKENSNSQSDVIPIERVGQLTTLIGNDPENAKSDDLVSWIAFLRQLRQLSPASDNQEPGTGKIEGRPGPSRVDKTRIGVIPRKRSWDLMPPDAFRPAATSSLGTILALALRLGMTWENFNVEEGALRAEGKGHSLLSTMIGGLGIVFQFHPCIDNPKNPLRHPNDTEPGPFADKLACGILPRSSLNESDISLRGKNIENTTELVAKALTGLSVSSDWAFQIAKVDRLQGMQLNGFSEPAGFPIHDMISVVSPFLHRRDSSVTRTPYPIQQSVALSAFLFWECRIGLLHQLGEVSITTPRPQLTEVLKKLQYLQDTYKADYLCQWDNAIVNEHCGDEGTRRAFLNDLRGIHNTTTAFFQREDARIPFKALVAAHFEMAAKVSFELHPPGEVNWGALVDWWHAVPRGYVDNLKDLCHNVRSKSKESEKTNCTDDDDLIRDAWWMMVLRGISWRMSIFEITPHKIIPSRLYNDNTRVYLM